MAVPTNTAVPTITGTAEVGELLTAGVGTWTAGPTSYAYQWYRVNANRVAITGATGHNYVVQASDEGHTLEVGVIATNNSGASAEAYSLPTALIPGDWFIVEDGTGKSNAVSYTSLEEARLYHAQRNNSAWAVATLGDKKAALADATTYLVEFYRLRWKGARATANQALDWPRNFVEREDYTYPTLNGSTFIGGYFYYPDNVVPQEVKFACAELALRALGGTQLAPDVGRLKRRSKVDVLEVEYEPYSKPYTQYRAIDGALAPLLKGAGNGNMMRLDRV